MRCVFCGNYFDFDKGKGINYMQKGICENCLRDVMLACLLKHRNGIKRFIHMTIQASKYGEPLTQEQGHMPAQ